MTEENNQKQNNSQGDPTTQPQADPKPKGESLDDLKSHVETLGTTPTGQTPEEAAESEGVVFEENIDPEQETKITGEDQVVSKEIAETELDKETLGASKDIFVEQEAPKEKPQLKKPKQRGATPALRTFKEDMERVMKKANTSFVGILAEEQKRRTSTKDVQKEKVTARNIYKLGAIVSGVFILLGVAVFAFILTYSNDATVPVPEEIPSHIFVERKQEVDVTDVSRNVFIGRLNSRKDNVTGTLGSIEQLYPINTVLTEEGEEKELVTPPEFFNRIDARVPTSFIRALGGDLTLGVHIFDGNEMLLIADVTSFENALSGMLSWERDMNNDLSPLFGPSIEIDQSTSTPFRNLIFTDRVIKNKEVRVLKDAGGGEVLFYSFIDRETLVITTEEQTFIEILSRISASRI